MPMGAIQRIKNKARGALTQDDKRLAHHEPSRPITQAANTTKHKPPKGNMTREVKNSGRQTR
jgi:hypothetical protein